MSNKITEDMKLIDWKSVRLPDELEEEGGSEIENIARYLKNTFDSMNRKPNKTMPEGSFIQYILPIIAGEKVFDSQYDEPNKPNASGVTIAEYIALAGSPYNEIDVVSGNTILFTLPPIFCKDVIVNKEVDKDISAELSIAALKSTDYKAQSDAMVTSTLMDRVALVPIRKENAILKSYLDRWNTILARYNKEPIFKLLETTKTEIKKQADVSLDFD